MLIKLYKITSLCQSYTRIPVGYPFHVIGTYMNDDLFSEGNSIIMDLSPYRFYKSSGVAVTSGYFVVILPLHDTNSCAKTIVNKPITRKHAKYLPLSRKFCPEKMRSTTGDSYTTGFLANSESIGCICTLDVVCMHFLHILKFICTFYRRVYMHS